MLKPTYTTYHGYECPPDIIYSLQQWAMNARPCGDFLQAVLRNDLNGAILRADPENLAVIAAIVGYAYDEMPVGCQGSQERMDEWARLGGLRGLEEGTP